jgi:hypothetical protein
MFPAAHTRNRRFYRDVLFKRERCIFVPKDQFDRFSHYVELELPDGRAVFALRMSIIAFCEAGSTLGYESSQSSPPTA